MSETKTGAPGAGVPRARQTTEAEPPAQRNKGFLGFVERAGDRIPHPALMFLILCGIVIVLSQILYLAGVHSTREVVVPPPSQAQYVEEGGSTVPAYDIPPAPGPAAYHIERETTHVQGLLTGTGARFLLTSTVDNFNGFGVVGVILVAMAGVGVAEEAGLIGALIRKLVKRAPPITITFIIVLVGIISSIASDAGYLVLIPLGAAAFYSLGRHPLAGLAAAYGGVSAAFAVNILITPIDGVLTQVTNEALHLVAPDKNINLTANLYFSIASTVLMAIVMTIYTDRFLSKRLGAYQGTADGQAADGVGEADESRGLRFAGIALLVCVGLVLLATIPPWGLLRNPDTGSLVNDSPFMEGLIFIITLVFLVAGVCYGRGARTFTSSNDVMNAITKTFAGLAGLIFMLLIISQFIAYFNYSNIATVVATELGDALHGANVPAVWLLVLFILVIYLLDIIIPGVIPKWAIFAPIFVPLFYRLGVGPQTVLAAYRVGDSPFNVITPLMVYLPFIVVVAQRYKKDAGIGTVISLMIPYALIVATIWIVMFVAWYLLGIPLGPGAPVKI